MMRDNVKGEDERNSWSSGWRERNTGRQRERGEQRRLKRALRVLLGRVNRSMLDSMLHGQLVYPGSPPWVWRQGKSICRGLQYSYSGEDIETVSVGAFRRSAPVLPQSF